MGINPYLLPTLLLAGAFFAAGYRLAARTRRPVWVVVLFATGSVLAMPGVLMALYYVHLYDHWMLFYRFRAVPGSEMTAAGAGFLGGALAHYARGKRLFSTSGLAVFVAIGILVPHIKPLFFRVKSSEFRDSWSSIACLQSTPSSCGPASVATLLRNSGIEATEQELARECYTYWGGTECWYMARALRRRGLHVTFLMQRPDEPVPRYPCIAGVRTRGTGHFVALLPLMTEGYLLADPLSGPLEQHEGSSTYEFTGFYMLVWRQG